MSYMNWLKENNRRINISLLFYPFILVISIALYSFLASLKSSIIAASVFDVLLIGCAISMVLASTLELITGERAFAHKVDTYIFGGALLTLCVPNIAAYLKFIRVDFINNVMMIVLIIGDICVSYAIVTYLSKLNKLKNILQSPTTLGLIGAVMTAIISGLLKK